VASGIGLSVADKPDSQDICFVPEGKYHTVIDRLRPQGAEPGDIVHMDGRVLGRHEGVTRYTIGQRKGLNVGGGTGEPLFVTRIDADRRQVIVGPREALLTRALTLKEDNWLGDEATISEAAAAGRAVLARVRSTREPVAGRLTHLDGVVGVALDTLEEGVAPGQACVLYAPEDPSRVLGGGFIERAVRAV
jgi:tRNA-specific 2-thiouridylase